ncbi:odontogenesis associated phosphoprotein [Ochotona curzoniae]|uniref:odontogenesis associated phosphoprotein n=1 Tax=Ochotona curzoniae TaxID=130825 RepID=UPI001B34A12C|nr:odontogenesis associated phosphoprotein [Ochotona curzoniae]
MARGPSFSCWFLVCWLAIAVAEGKDLAVTPPGGPENNMNPTDCQIFPLTPAPSTRAPVTGAWRTPRTPRCPFHNFPLRRPRVHLTLPNRPFFPPKCNHRFPFRPSYGPHGRLPLNYFPIRKLSSDSSSEESGEEREADTR